jgi:hypothetical protein
VIDQSQLSRQSTEDYINPTTNKKEKRETKGEIGIKREKKGRKGRKKVENIELLPVHTHSLLITQCREREITRVKKKNLVDLYFY